jgi:hypothetical protein
VGAGGRFLWPVACVTRSSTSSQIAGPQQWPHSALQARIDRPVDTRGASHPLPLPRLQSKRCEAARARQSRPSLCGWSLGQDFADKRYNHTVENCDLFTKSDRYRPRNVRVRAYRAGDRRACRAPRRRGGRGVSTTEYPDGPSAEDTGHGPLLREAVMKFKQIVSSMAAAFVASVVAAQAIRSRPPAIPSALSPWGLRGPAGLIPLR